MNKPVVHFLNTDASACGKAGADASTAVCADITCTSCRRTEFFRRAQGRTPVMNPLRCSPVNFTHARMIRAGFGVRR